MRQYSGGLVESRKNRVTGLIVSLYHGVQSGIDVDQAWVTVCEEHGMLVGHDTLKAARSWMAEPQTWCEDCQNHISRRGQRWEGHHDE